MLGWGPRDRRGGRRRRRRPPGRCGGAPEKVCASFQLGVGQGPGPCFLPRENVVGRRPCGRGFVASRRTKERKKSPMAMTKRRADAQRRREKHRREWKGEFRARIFAHASLRRRVCARIFAHSDHFLKQSPVGAMRESSCESSFFFFFQVSPCQGIGLLSP